ncbi:hypothetical protein RRG08_042733 [Elysia crispata]|uniref:Uncharacterized protein n=1 Tax=Elysia crispata TaxID=231223 RepID=A0AAE0XQL3_9GAST|nr:hypothetical protein RRG08_042733 [Elysia crispata]
MWRRESFPNRLASVGPRPRGAEPSRVSVQDGCCPASGFPSPVCVTRMREQREMAGCRLPLALTEYINNTHRTGALWGK